MDDRATHEREALTAMAETVKREYCAKAMVLDDDGDHVYLDGLDDDGAHVVFRYYVPLQTWDALKVIARGEGRIGDIPLVLLPPVGRNELTRRS
jgi:hypothetical protein